jgi:threonyl-tRNA synthetase
MIHRAVLGSLERFFAVIAEHFQGNWPMWLSPRQVTLCSVADRHVGAVREAARVLRAADVFVEVDASAETIGKKVRAAELLRSNLVGVIGDREVADGSIALRARSGDRLASVTAAHLVELVRAQMANFD